MATALPERPLPPVPPAARAIALLLASTPSITDAPPRVLQQLLEFSYRYTAQILQEAQVYAEHAGRPGRLTMDDVTLAIQARVGYEFGGRVPKEVSLIFRTTYLIYEPKPLMPFSPFVDSISSAWLPRRMQNSSRPSQKPLASAFRLQNTV